MSSFRDGFARLSLPTGSLWLLNDIAESKGKQDLYARQSPQVLRALVEMALVQSVESSNRIEGVTVSRERLEPLVLGQARPRGRSEEEIQGYRRALQLIHTSHRDVAITAETLRRLHDICQKGAGDAGEWKSADGEIVELRPGAPPRVRFRPVSARETPAAVEELCLSYRNDVAQSLAPPLVAVGALVLDFLCIHPFRDGNGRVSRLLTLLALYHHGYEVGRYISLERLVEESKEDYYQTLEKSSQGWHEGRHDLVPWLNYFWSVLRCAYRMFEERAASARQERGAKAALVRAAVDSLERDFSVRELEELCPGVSRETIRRTLKELRRIGRVVSLSRGPGARWRRKGQAPEKGSKKGS